MSKPLLHSKRSSSDTHKLQSPGHHNGESPGLDGNKMEGADRLLILVRLT